MFEILSEIKSFQSAGIFSSVRKYKPAFTSHPDDNSFFTALIVFTLKRLYPYLPEENKKAIEEIKIQANTAFEKYKSKKVEGTYNFWRTEKNAHFPNGILSKFRRFSLADDADCTALIYLACGYNSVDIINLREKLVYHSNLPVKVSNNTLPHYLNLKLYSTWFGKYIPIEVDICVTCNLLYLLIESGTPLNEFDKDSLKFICSVINNDEHKTQAFRVAPYYPKTSIILYHVARLLTITNKPDLLQLKEKLKADIFQKLKENIHPMERVILNTSLMWLGEIKNIENLEMSANIEFPWFIAGMLTSVNNSFARILASSPLFHIQFYCEAYMKTLFFEYKVLKDNLISRS